jgi:Ca2+-binding RTX toxin-like protein
MSIESIGIKGGVNLVGGVPTTMGDPGTSFGQYTIGAGGTLTATLYEDWTATAATSNNGTTKLVANGHTVDLTLAQGSHGWTVSNQGNRSDVTITGSAQNDTLIGGAGRDSLNGGAGDDTLTGGDGADSFDCNSGYDTITDLGKGGDALHVSGGHVKAFLAADWNPDSESNSDGEVMLIANNHNVNLSGGNIYGEAVEGTAGWTITNAGGVKRVYLVGSPNNDTLIGGTGDDFLDGGAGDDTLTGGSGFDSFACEKGYDKITDLGKGGDSLTVHWYGHVTATLADDWNANRYCNNNGEATLIANGHNVNLSVMGDGTQGWNITNGSNAKSVKLVGSFMNDTLSGGNGADTLDGGDGSDTYKVDGFHGYDSFKDSGSGDNDTIILYNGLGTGVTLGLKSIEGIEVINGVNGKNWISGGIDNDVWDFSGVTFRGTISINAGGGNNKVTGSQGDDYIMAGNGENYLNGGGGADTIVGGIGKSQLFGGDGNDYITGNSQSSEEINGGAGDDKLVGGTGKDVFVFDTKNWGNDVI